MRIPPFRLALGVGVPRWALFAGVLTCLCAFSGSRAAAQTLLRSVSGGPPTIVGSDLAVLEAGEPRQDLPCIVTPVKPALGFDLRFHGGFEISVPLRELAGQENLLSIIFRVTQAGSPNSPVYFSQKIRVPQLEADAKGDAYLQGAFDVGEGKYKVEWLMRDRTERVCATTWETIAELPARDRQLELALAAGEIAPTEVEQFLDEPPIPRDSGAGVNVKVLVNFAPQNNSAASLQPFDTSALVSILRQLQREPRIGSFSVTAFNLQEHKVLYRQSATDHIDFPAIGRAIDGLQLGRVDIARLQQKDSDVLFLGDLIHSELAVDQKPDAIIFAGPKTLIESTIPEDTLRNVGPLSAPVFYMNYNLHPQVRPWRDAIGHAVKYFKGQEFTISRPRDLWNAVTEIVAKVVKFKSERTATAAAHD